MDIEIYHSAATITGSLPHSRSIRRSRKSAHPSKTIVPSVHSTHLDREDKIPHSADIEDPSMALKRPRLPNDKRIEANARERERVHNLTGAFDALRQVIPMYGDQPKLSRLSVLRIACSYVLVLGTLNDIDFSEGQNSYTFKECFHILSSTILSELKRKKSSPLK